MRFCPICGFLEEDGHGITCTDNLPVDKGVGQRRIFVGPDPPNARNLYSSYGPGSKKPYSRPMAAGTLFGIVARENN